MTYRFKAPLNIIGMNPFVFVPEPLLQQLFRDAGKEKGYIPVTGQINAKDYKQTLLKYQGEWRLYINTTMLPRSPERIGECIEITIGVDSSDRTLQPHSDLVEALAENEDAKRVFESLSPSKQKEIIRYISSLKTDASRIRNIEKAIGFLLGKNRFVGRDKP